MKVSKICEDLRTEMREEAKAALAMVVQRSNLWPGLKTRLEEGEVFCVAQRPPQAGLCYVSLAEDAHIGEVVFYFEEDYRGYVYLCFEAEGKLYMLYVPENQEEWKAMRPKPNNPDVFVAEYYYKTGTMNFGTLRLETFISFVKRKS